MLEFAAFHYALDTTFQILRTLLEIAGQIKGHGTPTLARKVLGDVRTLYGKIFDIGLENYYRDIETRATISTFAKSANKPRDWRQRQENLEELIRRIVIHTTCHSKADHLLPVKSTAHTDILSKLKKGDCILTFNYDLLIEESLGTTKLWTPIGGYGENVHGVTGEWCQNWLQKRGGTNSDRSAIRLLKLHGSVNWTLYKTRQIKETRRYLKQSQFCLRASTSASTATHTSNFGEKRVSNSNNAIRSLLLVTHFQRRMYSPKRCLPRLFGFAQLENVT
jgi:hypothetical protein